MGHKICDCCKRAEFRDKEYVFKTGDVSICSTCVDMIHQYLHKQPETNAAPSAPATDIGLLTPRQIITAMNEHVVKQVAAKEKLAVAVAQHLRRVSNSEITYKANVLMFGPTGSGKTELGKAMAAVMNVPFVEVDCSQYSPSGYIGESPSGMIERLLIASNFDVKKAEMGVVFLDEIDKIAGSNSDGREFKSKSIQQEILKIVEGTNVVIKTPQAEYVVNTSKILFIAAGAFTDLPKYMGLGEVREISLVNVTKDQLMNETWQSLVAPKDMIAFGIMPELLGRFPVLAFTEELSEDDLMDVMIKPKNSVIIQMTKLLLLDNIRVEFDEEVLREIARSAKKDSLGARALKRSTEEHLASVFLNIELYSGKHLKITSNGIRIVAEQAIQESSVKTK